MKLVISLSGLNIAVHDRDSLTGGCNHYKIRNTLLPVDFSAFKCYLPRSDQVSPLFLLHSSLLNKHLVAATSPPPSLHILSWPPRRCVQIYHTNTGRQMTCHVPWFPRELLPLITPQSLADFSHSPPLSKHVENMAEVLFERHYRTLFGCLC